MAARKKSSGLSLQGEQTIRTIAEAHKALCAEFESRNEITLGVKNVEDVDLSFVQLVESARRTADRQGKTFSLDSGASGPLLEILQRGGFLSSPGASAFWLHTNGNS